jgi:methionyl-tRNA formyltransferase
MTRIAFLGTPGAAIPTLHSMHDSFEVAIVVTQPDRARGRSGRPVPPEVKESALEMGLKVAQPDSAAGITAALTAAAPLDLAVVVAYGRLLRPETLAVPDLGVLNVHFSLLPRWRGAAPVARALMAGDTMTGVTIIQLDAGLDTGPVLTAQALDIGSHEVAGELTDRLAEVGARLIADTIPGYAGGGLVPVPQSDDGLVYAEKLTDHDRPIDVTGGRGVAHNQIRGLSPSPGATLAIDGQTHKLLRSRPVDLAPEPGRWKGSEEGPVLGFSEGGLLITELQAPGRRKVTGPDWLRGSHAGTGSVG